MSDFYLLIVAAQAKPAEFDERVYTLIDADSRFQAWGEERKADLYAEIVDSVTVDDRWSVVERKVEEALRRNASRFHG